jgi:hypothetical protein
MASRPAMDARDSLGRHISLLNHDDSNLKASSHLFVYPRYDDAHPVGRPKAYPSGASSPSTPSLLRSDSHDSQNTHDPSSPITPSTYDFGAHPSYYSNTPYPLPSGAVNHTPTLSTQPPHCLPLGYLDFLKSHYTPFPKTRKLLRPVGLYIFPCLPGQP